MITPYSYKKSVLKDGKTVEEIIWTSNAEKREDLIKKFKQKGFDEMCKRDDRIAKMNYLDFPQGFTWLVNHFLKIWRHCESDISGNKIFTPRVIMDYCDCFGVEMSYRERQFLMKMKEWAVEAIVELKEHKSE